MPMVIVSPYAKAGYTDSTPATTESMLAFTEHLFGLPPLGRTDAQSYDFANAFSFAAAPGAGRAGSLAGRAAADGDDAHPGGRATLRPEPPAATHRHLIDGLAVGL